MKRVRTDCAWSLAVELSYHGGMMPPSPPQVRQASSPLADASTYEQALSRNLEWALTEGSLFFEGKGKVQETLRRITARLEQLGIPYAVAGGMALFLHGYRRFTEDVDILVTRDSLERIHQELDGRGYLRPFEKSKNLRDTQTKVKIEFLLSGGFPGDGRPKDISFPDPMHVAEIRDGIRVVNMEQLVSLKLASGMTGPGRTKDIGDVEELIRTLQLPEQLADGVHPYVREKYLQIWRKLSSARRYILLLGKGPSGAQAATLDDLIDAWPAQAEKLRAMRDSGVTLDVSGANVDDYVLVTNDPAVADRFGMHDESEYLDLDASGIPADH